MLWFDATGRRTDGWQLADAPKPSLCHQAAFVFVVHRDAFDVHAVGNVLVETPSGPPRPAATDRLGRLKTGEHAGPHKRDDEAATGTEEPAPALIHHQQTATAREFRLIHLAAASSSGLRLTRRPNVVRW